MPRWAWIAAACALAAYAGLVLALVVAGRRREARALAGFVPDCVVLCRRLLADPRVPLGSKLALAALAVYLAMPIDLVPDFVPVAGQLDDAILLGVVLRGVLRAAGPAVVAQHWPGPSQGLRILLRLAGRSAPEQG